MKITVMLIISVICLGGLLGLDWYISYSGTQPKQKDKATHTDKTNND